MSTVAVHINVLRLYDDKNPHWGCCTIIPGGCGDCWTVVFDDPITGMEVKIVDEEKLKELIGITLY